MFLGWRIHKLYIPRWILHPKIVYIYIYVWSIMDEKKYVIFGIMKHPPWWISAPSISVLFPGHRPHIQWEHRHLPIFLGKLYRPHWSLRLHWKWWLRREIIPKWSQFRLVKYYVLPRYFHRLIVKGCGHDLFCMQHLWHSGFLKVPLGNTANYFFFAEE